jgi:hypothetical protein
VTPSDDAVQERVKVYRRPPAGVRGAGVDREAPASDWRVPAPLEHDAGGDERGLSPRPRRHGFPGAPPACLRTTEWYGVTG